MEQLFDGLGIVPDLAGGETASEQTYVELNNASYLNIGAFALSGVLLYVYRRGLGAPGQYRDPVCWMRTDDSGPSLTHDGETSHFRSNRCQRSFENHPVEFVNQPPRIREVELPGSMNTVERRIAISSSAVGQRVVRWPIKTGTVVSPKGARMSKHLEGSGWRR